MKISDRFRWLCTAAAGLLNSLSPQASAAPLPQFVLQDINTSKLAGTQTFASPRQGLTMGNMDYRGRVVVVYFGQEN